MTSRRGTSNSNVRGSSYTRRRRKQWLLDSFGDGITAPCHKFVLCGTMLTFDTITVDRIIPGILGGRYVRGNIRPACMFHNASDGGKLAHTIKKGLV